MKLANGPAIAVHFHFENGALHSARLSLDNHFNAIGATADLLDWLHLYTQGISSPLPILTGSSFQTQALRALQAIPFGSTITYSGLASLCGHPKAARAIGNACHSNRFPLLIPCHRVIRANGEMGGFATDIEIKRRLLEFEASEACLATN